jgi:hypothetical protein
MGSNAQRAMRGRLLSSLGFYAGFFCPGMTMANGGGTTVGMVRIGHTGSALGAAAGRE